MLYTFLQTLAIALTFESAIFLIKGKFMLTAESIAKLSGAFWDHNPHLVKSLSRETMDTRVGAILLLLSFAIQMIVLLRGQLFDDIGPANKVGLSYGVVLGIIVYFIGCWTSSHFAKKTENKIEEILSKPNKFEDCD